jgi:hypothetical protein
MKKPFKGGDVMKTDPTPQQTEHEMTNISVQKIIIVIYIPLI